jgi:hypothetical protein
LKDDLPKNYTINDVKDALDDAGYSTEYSKYIKEGEAMNETFPENDAMSYEDGGSTSGWCYSIGGL